MKALIVLGGDAPGKALLEACVKDCDFSIAADRGLEAFDAAEVVPDLMLGDMDSVSSEILERYKGHVELETLNCVKDDTDGEHALNTAIARGADGITILGALGGRLDHALANLMLLVRAKRLGVSARLLDERVSIRCVDGCIELLGAAGDTVSLLPLGEAHDVTLDGFFYPLKNGRMASDNSLGISNVVTADRASVSVGSGDLLLFHYYSESTAPFGA